MVVLVMTPVVLLSVVVVVTSHTWAMHVPSPPVLAVAFIIVVVSTSMAFQELPLLHPDLLEVLFVVLDFISELLVKIIDLFELLLDQKSLIGHHDLLVDKEAPYIRVHPIVEEGGVPLHTQIPVEPIPTSMEQIGQIGRRVLDYLIDRVLQLKCLVVPLPLVQVLHEADLLTKCLE